MEGGLGQDDRVRAELWRQVQRAVEDYWKRLDDFPIVPELDPEAVRADLKRFTFDRPEDPAAAVQFVVQNLSRNQTHYSHPAYTGLFVPNPTSMSTFAETLATGFNSQLATWHSSPFAVELEQHLLRRFGELFGYASEDATGTFTSGGSEANHTAVLTALKKHFPEISTKGLAGLNARPTIYVSSESHHSLHKAVVASGLGLDCLREIPVDGALAMDVAELGRVMAEDRERGFRPLMIVATVGTPAAGAIDPVAEIARVAEDERAWLHMDACYGGAAVILPELAALFEGSARADSIALDAHKWLSVSAGTGMFLTRHRGILQETFAVETAYATRASDHLDVVQPFASSLQWSRRFIGLNLFLSLAVEGIGGYRASLRRQLTLADGLRRSLAESGWTIENKTRLPVICFTDASGADIVEIARRVNETKRLWISTTRFSNGKRVLRVGIVNHKTAAREIESLVTVLNSARAKKV